MKHNLWCDQPITRHRGAGWSAAIHLLKCLAFCSDGGVRVTGFSGVGTRPCQRPGGHFFLRLATCSRWCRLSADKPASKHHWPASCRVPRPESRSQHSCEKDPFVMVLKRSADEPIYHRPTFSRRPASADRMCPLPRLFVSVRVKIWFTRTRTSSCRRMSGHVTGLKARLCRNGILKARAFL